MKLQAAKKGSSIILLTLLVASIFPLLPTATALAKPSVPEFTIRYVDYSYDVPAIYGTDQYTGATIITRQGEHIDKRTIEFKIKNQPFVPYNDTSGHQIKLYYNFQFKGPYGEAWSNYPDTSHTYGYFTGLFPDTSASNDEYTIVQVSLPALTSYPSGTPPITTGTVEFQVQAIFGYVDGVSTGMIAGGYYGFEGQRSDWSNTQTVTIGKTAPAQHSTVAPTNNDNSTLSGTQQGFTVGVDWQTVVIVVLAVVVIVLVLVVVLQRRNGSGKKEVQ